MYSLSQGERAILFGTRSAEAVFDPSPHQGSQGEAFCSGPLLQQMRPSAAPHPGLSSGTLRPGGARPDGAYEDPTFLADLEPQSTLSSFVGAKLQAGEVVHLDDDGTLRPAHEGVRIDVETPDAWLREPERLRPLGQKAVE